MPRSPQRAAAAAATSLLLACGLAAAATTASGAPAPSPAAAAPGSQEAQSSPAGAPTGFVDLPARPVADDGAAHELTVHYRNTGTAARTVAPQVLVESPDAGPYLAPSDLRLERFDPATRTWAPMALGTQTGTLYTAIPAAGRRLAPGADLDVRYRLTVEPAGMSAARHAVVQPRIVLFGSAAA
ncbi:signal peptide protein [Streptomyces sp. NPDC001380]|uniref:signal peptide protein n=1 Tax=Streptomyces sp. NPDC001380 TaxID=3364566 RepID=UPI003681035C